MVAKKRKLNKQGKYGWTVRIPPDFMEWLDWDGSESFEICLDSENKQLTLKKVEDKKI